MLIHDRAIYENVMSKMQHSHASEWREIRASAAAAASDVTRRVGSTRPSQPRRRHGNGGRDRLSLLDLKLDAAVAHADLRVFAEQLGTFKDAERSAGKGAVATTVVVAPELQDVGAMVGFPTSLKNSPRIIHKWWLRHGDLSSVCDVARYNTTHRLASIDTPPVV